MDDKTRELARDYMRSASARIQQPSPKFSVKLPDTQERSSVMLLGIYGAVVEGRGVEFQMDDATVSKVERVVKWMHESPKRGLLLCGTLGNGKTTMLRALGSLFGTRAVYREAQEIYEYFRQNQSLPPVSSSELLLIDDLGVEPASYNSFGELRYPLAELLLQRYKSNSTTVIATNLTFDQIGATYGDRLQDRMREMYAMIIYSEPSYRK